MATGGELASQTEPSVSGPFGGLGGVFPPFVYGWREVFVPLVVLVHNQHGAVLATAGLAVAAVRLGEWLESRMAPMRSPLQSAFVAGMALLLLGLAPEEGPIALLLWAVFGLAWPVLRRSLVGEAGLAGPVMAWLLLGMALAGPLVLGPGTWLIAAGCLACAWRWRRQEAAPVVSDSRRSEGRPLTLLPFLYSASYLAWAWLMPARLLAAGIPLAACGAAMAAGWFLREPARLFGIWLSARWGTRPLVVLAALGATAVVLGMAWVDQAWPLVVLLAVHGLLMGLIDSHPAVVAQRGLASPPSAQALGEGLAPLLGVGALLLAGTGPAFGVGALAAMLMALLATLDRSGLSMRER
jgi:hypothetical protein